MLSKPCRKTTISEDIRECFIEVCLFYSPVGNDVHPLVTSEHAGAAVTMETIYISFYRCSSRELDFLLFKESSSSKRFGVDSDRGLAGPCPQAGFSPNLIAGSVNLSSEGLITSGNIQVKIWCEISETALVMKSSD